LLPDGVDHKVSIFENLPEGVWEDVTPTIDKTLIPSIPDRFSCRELEAHDILERDFIYLRGRIS
jgi:hypothetical protein